MPKRAGSRLDWIFPSAADYRAEAEKWEHVRTLAEEDGDDFWSKDAANEAANLRQRAREMEADAAAKGEKAS